jgi:hypothetical protein
MSGEDDRGTSSPDPSSVRSAVGKIITPDTDRSNELTNQG